MVTVTINRIRNYIIIIIIIIIILSGVLEMVSVATNDANIGSVINHIAWRIQNNGVREYICTVA